jgi:hypothetical protein
MNKETQGQGQALAGTQPYGFVEGARHISNGRSDYHGQGVEIAPPSGTEYGGVHYKNGLCQAMNQKEEPCKAPKAKGTNYCVGHLNSFNKMLESKEETPAPKEEEVTVAE